MNSPSGPILFRDRLRARLRELREGSGLTLQQVADAMSWSISKTIRIEAGGVSITVNDLKVLLDVYRATDPQERERLLDYARRARRHSWVGPYREAAGAETAKLAEYESEAVQVFQFHPLLVPELLQTAEYAAALDEMFGACRRDLLAARQSRLLGILGAEGLTVVLDETALERPVGGPQVMHQQAQHLRAMVRHPAVNLRLLSASTPLQRILTRPTELLVIPGADRLVFAGDPWNLVGDEFGWYQKAAAELVERSADPRLSLTQAESRWEKW